MQICFWTLHFVLPFLEEYPLEGVCSEYLPVVFHRIYNDKTMHNIFKVHIRTQNPVKAYFVYVGFSLQGLLPAREASIPQDTGADTHRNPCSYNSAQDIDSGCRRGGARGRPARKETDPKVFDCSDNREPVT